MYVDLYKLVDEGIATEEVIALISGIWGNSETVFNDVLFYYTGFRNWEQYCDNYGIPYEE